MAADDAAGYFELVDDTSHVDYVLCDLPPIRSEPNAWLHTTSFFMGRQVAGIFTVAGRSRMQGGGQYVVSILHGLNHLTAVSNSFTLFSLLFKLAALIAGLPRSHTLFCCNHLLPYTCLRIFESTFRDSGL